MKLMFFLVIIFLLFSSCEPERYCNEPRCAYSDVNLNSPIIATLSGNMDSIIKVGDTLKLIISLPRELQTSYGNIKVQSILTNSFFGIIVGGYKLRIHDNTNAKIEQVLITSSKLPDGTPTWSYLDKKFECLFIPKETGKFFIEIIQGRLEIKEEINNREWLINSIIQFENIPFRPKQYSSWWVDSMQNDIYNKYKNKKDWYCFEVK